MLRMYTELFRRCSRDARDVPRQCPGDAQDILLRLFGGPLKILERCSGIAQDAWKSFVRCRGVPLQLILASFLDAFGIDSL